MCMKDEKFFIKEKVAWKYLFSDWIKWCYFSRIWLWQRPKFYYLDYEAKKNLKEPFMIVMNHQGFIDPVMVYYAFFTKRIFFMAHQNIMQTKFKGWIFQNLLCIPIDPDTGSFQSLRVMMDVLKKGNPLGVFPEGHINFNSTETKEFKGGATFLALQTGVDVIMLYRERRKHWWQRNHIIVGKPYNPRQMAGGSVSRSELDRVNQEVFAKELELKRLYQEMYTAKECERSNIQVFISPMPFECKSKIYPKQRAEEIASCKSEKTRNDKFYAWKLLEKVFKEQYGENIKRLHFKKQENGKWVCDKYKVSISHSGELVAVAVAKFGVGIDLQAYDQVNVSDALIDKVFNEDEKPNDNSKEAFIKGWGLKESAFKLSNDDAYNPKHYNVKDIKNSECNTIIYNDKEYNLSVVGEVNDFISYHFMTPDVKMKEK